MHGTFSSRRLPVEWVFAMCLTWRAVSQAFSAFADTVLVRVELLRFHGCARGSWVVLIGASQTAVWTQQLANLLSPGALDSLRDGFVTDGSLAADQSVASLWRMNMISSLEFAVSSVRQALT